MSSVEIDGLTVRVPAAYAKYTQAQKAAVDRLAEWLLATYKREHIVTVFVHRVAKRKGKWVAFGGYGISDKPHNGMEK